MKYIVLVCSFLFLSSLAQATDLKNDHQKSSYAVGLEIGAQLKKAMDFGEKFDLVALQDGISDILSESAPQLSDEERKAILVAYQKRLSENSTRYFREALEKNKREASEFLTSNRDEDGVMETPSGLQYKVLREGQGPKPKPDATVKVQYVGKLLDGKEFENSYIRDESAAVLKLNQLIKGWAEGLQLMPVGSKFEFYIPAHLAYGDSGTLPAIPPGALLVYTVELLAIQ